MKKTHKNSRIEVWSGDYINDERKKAITDMDAVIVQIEYAANDDYIVEVVDKEDFECLNEQMN